MRIKTMRQCFKYGFIHICWVSFYLQTDNKNNKKKKDWILISVGIQMVYVYVLIACHSAISRTLDGGTQGRSVATFDPGVYLCVYVNTRSVFVGWW